ncbi:hypothetical protein DRJ25_03345, partial [Candidatus Woesearchaeota archaeon]
YLKDGVIINNIQGIYGSSPPALFMNNVSIEQNSNHGIELRYTDSNNPGEIKNSIIWNNSNRGLYFYNVDNYNISNNNITNNTNYDIYLTSSSNNNFLWNNTFESNSSMFDAASDNNWNKTAPVGGNRWLFFDEPSEGCYDNDDDGFCDDANVTIPGGGTGKDELPLFVGSLGVSCGDTITTNTTLNSNLTCNGTALYLAADNIRFVCNNTYIKGNGTGIGIKVNESNVTIQNCKITNFAQDVVADPGTGLRINNSYFNNSANCTVLNAFNDSFIFNNSYFNCTQNAIVLINNSNNNSIYNNNINQSYVGVNILSGENNTVWNNTFINSTHAHANSVANNNFNNSVTGNYWDDILTLKIFDTDSDGLGDAGSQYPYNNTNNANVTGKVNDYKPFTTKTPGALIVNVSKPADGFISDSLQVNISCSANSSDVITNLSFTLWNADGSFNQSNSTNPGVEDASFSWNITLLDGNYIVGCNATDFLGQTNRSSNNSFRVDTVPPPIGFYSPTTSSGNHSQTWIFANVSVTYNHLDNMSIFLYNSSKDLINTTSSNTFPLAVNFSGLPNGLYYLNASANDTAGNYNKTETRAITLDTVYPSVEFKNPTTASGIYSQDFIETNVSVNDSNLLLITTSIFDAATGNLVNSSTNNTSPFFFNFTGLGDGTYLLNASAEDGAGHKNKTETRNITLDTTAPIINLISPADGTSTTQTTITFSYNLTDITRTNCTLTIDNSNVSNQTNMTTGTYNFTQTLTTGTHHWNITCTDELNQANTSNTRTLTITSPASTGGAAGAGGGGGPVLPSYSVIVEPLKLNKRSKITISPEANGDLVILFEKDDKWFFFDSLKVSNGAAYFIPTKLGTYRFDFKISGKVVGSSKASARQPIAERPFAFDDYFKSRITRKVSEETKKEKVPEKALEEKEEPPAKEELDVPEKPTRKKTKSRSLPLISGLAAFLLLGILAYRPAKNFHKNLRLKSLDRKLFRLKKKFGSDR